ncbi:hypothetical protein [Cyanobium gracile]|uniref:Lysozyme inhibitor n=1 Tax=Cyanobium gracile UHCC 0281 TaxID=3110309 RepID=A0ABU5SVE5_9CYAN|nr:hypothetical protein [Cyanobium gracile]MEA5442492.1 hypothetical protein [Cyanobium gracile UHCC 0281]
MAAPPLLALGLLPLLTMQSPWWENYDIRERFLCGGRVSVVLERNASQASLIAGRTRSTLFREESDAPGLRYQNESLRVILRGDELTLEQLPSRRICVRSEQV